MGKAAEPPAATPLLPGLLTDRCERGAGAGRAERGGDMSAARPGAGPRAVSGASRLEPVEKVVTQFLSWGGSALVSRP